MTLETGVSSEEMMEEIKIMATVASPEDSRAVRN
jgi:hypothetical protein